MNPCSNWKVRVLAVLAVLGLITAACGGDDDDRQTNTTHNDSGAWDITTTTTPATASASSDQDPVTGLPVIDPFEVSSDTIAIAGSSTVFPLSAAVMTLWEDEGGPGYPIDSIGTGGGFERFCVEGASDIANASRPIKESEVEACREIGRDPLEIRVGSDALSVVVNRSNYFVDSLSVAQIATAFSLTEPGSTWAEVDPSFPAHPIQMFSPGADSGTFDYFNEVIFEEADPPPILSSIAQIVGEDDNVTVAGVAEDGCTEGDLSSTCAIGYFGYAFLSQNADRLRAIGVDGIYPGDETVNDSSYPISRPLYLYTDAGVIAQKPQVAQFVAFYLNRVGEVVEEVGYFPAPTETVVATADSLRVAAGW